MTSPLKTNASLTLRDMLLALLVAIMWGSNNIAAKFAMAEIPPLMTAGVRFIILAVLLGPWLRLSRADLKRVLPIALASGPMHFALLYTGFGLSHHVGAMSVVTLLWVPITTVLAMVVLAEKPTSRQVAGLALAFAGVVVMGFQPAILLEYHSVLLCAGAALCWGTAVILTRRAGTLPGLSVQAWMALLTGPSLIISSVLTTPHVIPRVLHASGAFWFYTAFGIVAGSLFGNVVLFNLVSRNPVTKVTPILLLTPVVSLICGVITLHEEIGIQEVMGAAATIMGALLVTLAARQKPLLMDAQTT